MMLINSFLGSPNWILGVNPATDPYFSDVATLWHCDDLTDVKAGTGTGSWTLRDGASIVTNSHYGASTLSINGGTQNAKIDNTNFHNALLTTNWTLEFFVSVSNTGVLQTLISKGYDVYPVFEMSLDVLADGKLRYSVFPTSSSVASRQSVTSTASIPFAAEWVHIAIVQTNTTVQIYANGTLFCSASLRMAGSAYPFVVGRFHDTAERNQSTAFFDEFRLTKNIARYTGAFTPPNIQFPNS